MRSFLCGSLVCRDPSVIRSISPCPPPNTSPHQHPTHPRSLPLHRVNPEPAVPDRANPKDPYKRQRGQKDQTARQWRQLQKPALDKWARVKFYEGNSGIEKNSPSAEQQLVPSLKAGEERRGKSGWTAKKEQRKVTGMIRWEGELWTNSKTLFYTQTLPHPGSHILPFQQCRAPGCVFACLCTSWCMSSLWSH